MTIHPRTRRIALGVAALLMAAAPAAVAFAQPYDGSYAQDDQARYRQSQYEEQRRAYDAQYGPGAYDRYNSDQRARAEEACREHKSDKAAGATIAGAIGGALIGNSLSRGGGRTAGTIIGGVGGAAIGNSVANGSVHCD
jgi:hypothetical protein